ncbi:hypothetical protein D3C87_1890010 [compost metagenome]
MKRRRVKKLVTISSWFTPLMALLDKGPLSGSSLHTVNHGVLGDLKHVFETDDGSAEGSVLIIDVFCA